MRSYARCTWSRWRSRPAPDRVGCAAGCQAFVAHLVRNVSRYRCMGLLARLADADLGREVVLGDPAGLAACAEYPGDLKGRGDELAHGEGVSQIIILDNNVILFS